VPIWCQLAAASHSLRREHKTSAHVTEFFWYCTVVVIFRRVYRFLAFSQCICLITGGREFIIIASEVRVLSVRENSDK
jgi:hypothetical protein